MIKELIICSVIFAPFAAWELLPKQRHWVVFLVVAALTYPIANVLVQGFLLWVYLAQLMFAILFVHACAQYKARGKQGAINLAYQYALVTIVIIYAVAYFSVKMGDALGN